MGQTTITTENLAEIFTLFSTGIGIGGLISAIVWAISYTVKKCIGFFKL